jgi:hypothetical protein
VRCCTRRYNCLLFAVNGVVGHRVFVAKRDCFARSEKESDMSKLLIALTAGLFAASAAYAQGAASTPVAASAPAVTASAPVAASGVNTKKHHARHHHGAKVKRAEQRKAASHPDSGGTGSK